MSTEAPDSEQKLMNTEAPERAQADQNFVMKYACVVLCCLKPKSTAVLAFEFYLVLSATWRNDL